MPNGASRQQQCALASPSCRQTRVHGFRIHRPAVLAHGIRTLRVQVSCFTFQTCLVVAYDARGVSNAGFMRFDF